MDKKTILIFILIAGFLQSCFDLHENKTYVYKNYFVSTNPGNGLMALYYDIDGENSIERVDNIKRAGHAQEIIIVENREGFYFIDSKKDNEFINSTEIIGKLRTQEEFEKLLDSLKVKDFKFDYYKEK